MANKSDIHYISQVLSGNVEAYSTIVSRHQNFIYTLVLRMVKNKQDAEELTQDTFITAFDKLAAYRREAQFTSWIYTIAYRKALDHLKKQKVACVLDEIDSVPIHKLGAVDNALEQMEKKEAREIIQFNIFKLSPKMSSIITLYYYQNLSVKEISKITSLSVNNVKILLHRGRNKLFISINQQLISEYIQQ